MPQSLSNVLVHLVFSTRERIPMIPTSLCPRLHGYIAGVARAHGCPPLQVGGVQDHVHILLQLSRTLTIAQVAEKVKTSSSKWMKEFEPAFAWQAGYGAFSVSPGEAGSVVHYIAEQEAHHRKASFQDEFRELMRTSGIEIDERYVWD